MASTKVMGRIMLSRFKSDDGFTLIELMIVVAVISILAAIALPSYNEYIRRGHRADARTGLLQANQWLERAATANGVYPSSLPSAMTWSSDASRRYTIGISGGGTSSNFTLVATRKTPGPQATDKCGDYTLTYNGVQGNNNMATGVTSADCWRK